jgi:hypothetical protein
MPRLAVAAWWVAVGYPVKDREAVVRWSVSPCREFCGRGMKSRPCARMLRCRTLKLPRLNHGALSSRALVPGGASTLSLHC